MYEGCPVELQMEKNIASDGIFDEAIYHCSIVRDDEEGVLTLLLKGDELAMISLDAKYRCYIKTKKEFLLCTGVICERYQSQGDSMILFRIENGFYEQSLD
jgi:hypothetical protein